MHPEGADSYYNHSNYKSKIKWDEGHYGFTIVARVDGTDHDVDDTNWNNPNQVSDLLPYWYCSDNAYKSFVDRMCKILGQKSNERQLGANKDGSKKYNYFPTQMPYHERSDGRDAKLIRWLICYRIDDPDKIEIWAGDGHKAKNEPVYCVYPDTNANYDW